ncbi:MAG: hypothetical protein PUB21_10570 [Bacteroidales bacterium]|nr:hypothetical protein [Bacteroidales bacterium]
MKKRIFCCGFMAVLLSLPLSVFSQSINLNTSESITFLQSNYENGYATKIYSTDDGGGVTSLRFGTRGNTTAYTDALLIRVADATAGGNGNVYVGLNSSKSSTYKDSKFGVYQSQLLGSTKGNYTAIATFGGQTYSGNNTLKETLWLFRETAGSTWTTARLHNGISVDNAFVVPGSTTKTWWERDPNDNIQSWGNEANTYMTLKSGNLGIGVTNPTRKLEVNGTIRAKEVIVETTGSWADYVFDKDYKLPSLAEVENHIKEYQHLPEIPSAAEVNTNGVNLAEMNVKLLQKVEELTLYIIEQDKSISLLKEEVDLLKSK